MNKPRLNLLILLAIASAFSLPAAAAERDQPIVVSGTEIFYGVIPAPMLLTHPAGHPERTMHGGVQGDRDSYHLLVSIFDTSTRMRITNAQVQASVGGAEPALQTKPLESMSFAGVVTYGNYFTLSGPGPFRITLNIKRPDRSPLRTDFEYRHR